jgi:anti-sigma factor RsiW
MCPDRQLLSVYLDGELPSPWREKLESHLASCLACSRRLDVYRAVGGRTDGSAAGGAETPSAERMEAAKARVWRNVAGLDTAARRPAKGWRRTLVLPLPAAIAAVLVVATAAAFVGGPVVAGVSKDREVARIASDVQGAIPVSDMAGVLSYLEAQDASTNIVIIQLPESQSFTPSGEPAFVRAADYVRRSAP